MVNNNNKATHNKKNNAHIVEKLKLPRPDWFDAEGRIYKDALIENFNAIEDKLLELSRVDAFSVQPPDINDIAYPDIEDLSTTDDRSIINLKSFLNLTGLMGYPLECVFSGTVAKKISFYNSAYKYFTISDKETNANATNPYIYLNWVNNTVAASNTTITPTNSCLIGVYEGGIVKCVNDKDSISINPLFYLSRMSKESHYIRTDRGTRDKYSCYDGIGSNGRLWGAADTNKKTGTTNNIYFLDVGRYSE